MLSQWLSSAWQKSLLIAALFAVAVFGMPLQVQAVGSTEIISLTNNERARAGLTPLNYDGRLASSAYAKAQDMLAKGYWAHTSPDGTSPWYFVSQAGYSYVTVGENLAKGFATDAAVVAGWMASSGHRANILNPAFKDIGIGVASGVFAGEQTTIVVAHYGAAAATPPPKPAPAPVAAAPKAAAQSVQTNRVQAPVPEAVPAPVAAPEKQQVAVEVPQPKKQLDIFIENLIKIIELEHKELAHV